jgi:preprotein translocase subunit Sec61beta
MLSSLLGILSIKISPKIIVSFVKLVLIDIEFWPSQALCILSSLLDILSIKISPKIIVSFVKLVLIDIEFWPSQALFNKKKLYKNRNDA